MMTLQRKLRIYREKIAQFEGITPSTKITIACLLHLNYDDLIKTSEIQSLMGYAPATSYTVIRDMLLVGVISKVHKKTTYYWKFEELEERKSI